MTELDMASAQEVVLSIIKGEDRNLKVSEVVAMASVRGLGAKVTKKAIRMLMDGEKLTTDKYFQLLEARPDDFFFA